jgi:flavin-dependent dehydrogenase
LNDFNNRNSIKILGGGLSGLSSAISLAKRGVEVEVFEKRLHAGGRFNRDFQGLRNFGNVNGDRDPIKEFKDIDIYLKPYKNLKRIVLFSRSYRFEINNNNKPIYYCFLRGRNNKSIDHQLEKLAIKYGAKIHYNATLNLNEVDIVATGPSKIDGIAYGGIYENTNIDDSGYVFLDKRFSPDGYLYVIPGEKKGEAEVVNTAFTQNIKIKDIKSLFNLAIEKNKFLRNILDGANRTSVQSGISCSTIKNKFHYKNKYYVGEAAGLQDVTAGFGMRYAIISGHLAAHSIITGEDYDHLLFKYFKSQLEFEHMRRRNLKKLSNKELDKKFKLINEKNDGKITLDQYVAIRGVI